jgi:hypothetical protein
MPAFGKTEPDQVIWQIAAFLHVEHGVTAQQFAALAGQPSQPPTESYRERSNAATPQR